MAKKSTTKPQMSAKQIRRRRRRRRRKILLFVIGFLIIAGIWLGILLFFSNRNKKDADEAENTPSPSPEITTEPEENAQPESESGGLQTESQTDPQISSEPEAESEKLPTVDLNSLNSKSAILVRLSDMKTIAEKNADERIYPASMTKIMTAIVGLEQVSDMEQTLTISQTTYDALYLEGASLAGFVPGDACKMKDIFYGILLPSGAECCVGLAEYLYGSESAFVDVMNQKAQELGMTNTHFVTSTGLHDPEHYTTVRDLTKLLNYALQNETFRTIYCTADYTTSPMANVPNGLHFHSTMFKKMESSAVTGGEILGGKTGYTSDAGQCLASLARVNGTEYILVTAGAEGGPSGDPHHIWDAQNVYNQIGASTE